MPNLFILINLLILSVQDLRKKKVAVWALVIFAITVVAINLLKIVVLKEKINYLDYLLSLGLFAILAAMSIFFKNIAMADAITIGLISLANGFIFGILSFFIASLVAAVVALIGLAIKKFNKKTSLPYIPFLLLAFIVVILGKG